MISIEDWPDPYGSMEALSFLAVFAANCYQTFNGLSEATDKGIVFG